MFRFAIPFQGIINPQLSDPQDKHQPDTTYIDLNVKVVANVSLQTDFVFLHVSLCVLAAVLLDSYIFLK